MKKTSSDLLLLDANVLIALAWPNHQFHSIALRALSNDKPWATCALTQLAFIRISSNPAAVGSAKTPHEAALMLSEMVADEKHVFINDQPSPVSKRWVGLFAGLLGHRQVTDAYLLRLAKMNGATFVTFDQKLKSHGDGKSGLIVLG